MWSWKFKLFFNFTAYATQAVHAAPAYVKSYAPAVAPLAYAAAPYGKLYHL